MPPARNLAALRFYFQDDIGIIIFIHSLCVFGIHSGPNLPLRKVSVLNLPHTEVASAQCLEVTAISSEIENKKKALAVFPRFRRSVMVWAAFFIFLTAFQCRPAP